MIRKRPLQVVGANGFSSAVYGPFISHLRDTFDVDVTDVFRQAHGTSWTAAVRHLTLDLERRKLAGGPLACFGHSLGGALLYIVAVQRPDLFTRLVVFDPPMFHPAKRLGMQLAFPFSALRQLHPLIASTYRKRASFRDLDEARAYFTSRRLHQTFDERVLEAVISGELQPSQDQAGVELVFSPASERFFYETTPCELWGPKLGQYGSTAIPGSFLYSSRHDFLSQWDVAYLRRQLASLRFVPIEDAHHFLPMQEPERMARLVQEQLDVTEG